MNRLIRAWTWRAVQVLKRASVFARRRWTAADVWVQDHHAGVGGTVLVLLCVAVGLLLRFRMDQVTELAKQFAPVCTIISITVTAIFSWIKWVRKRRKTRLATAGAARP
ncbi:hypothetical protein OOK43_32120 [[Kitasatospora] papulosa]|uniref:hypothetical protein n=1 Tax=Streptomyces TaxID=1883 RepID=UPI00224C9881|nr:MULTISPECIES: hypothetical protein [Streptomyces]MCX4417885.1 hypothetical protein [[Kitasatospora] papulosa]MCY1649384.1 hypothetical protein [Streptomyces sp. SL203]MCY1677096.1 hypothetical protein [Streptomyces sp. SL294]